jgi:hypothetical protein
MKFRLVKIENGTGSAVCKDSDGLILIFPYGTYRIILIDGNKWVEI